MALAVNGSSDRRRRVAKVGLLSDTLANQCREHNNTWGRKDGTSVAEAVLSGANDITVVDTDAKQLGRLQDRLDLRTVAGNAALPSGLRAAGARDAALLIAVTQSDQANLCACRTAHLLFGVPQRIAHLPSSDYAQYRADPVLARVLAGLARLPFAGPAD